MLLDSAPGEICGSVQADKGAQALQSLVPVSCLSVYDV